MFKEVVKKELETIDISLPNQENAMPVLQAVITQATISAIPYSITHHERAGEPKWYPEPQTAILID